MAEIKMTGNMKVKTLRTQFKEAFGSTLRVYNGVKFADDDATLASIRAKDAKGGELAVKGNMQVGNFENKVKELYGIKVQVANADDSALADNSITLTAAGK
ncbi:MAG: hypothetical protein KBT45_08310 [Bacteroidales bacterium]|nr:hypothetical protein [Candidatus Colimorpha pelethequi]MCQ2261851.1 hypothetical protein [Bacteroidales bacterium]